MTFFLVPEIRELQGFWKKFGEYREQPTVYYKQRFIVLLKGASISNYLDNYYLWSSYPLLNHAEEAHTRIAVTEIYESDWNDDGKPDLMETAILADLERSQATSALTVSGDLWLQQATPFWSSGRDADNGGPLIDESSLNLGQYSPVTIAFRNSLRNFTTTLKRKVRTWTAKQIANRNFTLRLSLRIVEQQIVYQTGLFELLKWAWIQYFAIFVVVHFFVNKFRKFLLKNHLLNTIIVGANDKHFDGDH